MHQLSKYACVSSLSALICQTSQLSINTTLVIIFKLLSLLTLSLLISAHFGISLCATSWQLVMKNRSFFNLVFQTYDCPMRAVFSEFKFLSQAFFTLTVDLGRIRDGEFDVSVHFFHTISTFAWSEFNIDVILETSCREINHYL